jgi:hypothetical protein
LAATRQGSTDRIGLGTQQTDIDHRSERLPLLTAWGRRRIPAQAQGGTMS